ncbi:hypothetical protein SIL72_05095 [Rubrobacter radiotolerans]|uniref:Uncharacterized protein n=1 Tax=Rubrobacter radiotolerans TaxID=42256 RepID=A0AB35T438_RUBRA|nr:hypothetical protein [Rubrobacter radiotolerans]MDX5893402.1 hypothetical protein [Rubrobacter radiotolerans]
MDRDVDGPPVLDDYGGLAPHAEAAPLHLPKEELSSGPARIGEKRLAPLRKELRDEVRERRYVAPFVEDVRREHEVEGAETFEPLTGPVPVEQACLCFDPGVLKNVVRGEVEGGGVMVGEGYRGPAPGGDGGG